ncbi:MAG: class I SAM-dependent RNA methyltransferase [Pyrinomonadaceae bacterium]
MKTFNKRELTVRIEKIVPNGYGLAFAEGLTVFVALAAAGDKLRVRLREKKGKIAFAEIVEILEPSSDRAAPECRYFGRCGGCDFQQLNYAAQLAAKLGIIRDCLTRIGKINYEKEIEIIVSPQPYKYRSRAQWHADTRARKLGYFKRYSHEIIDVENCPILDDTLEKTLENFRRNLNWEEFWAEKIEIETASAEREVSVYSNELIEPTREISFTARGEKYLYDAGIFFQGNQFLIERLIDLATTGASGANALDLFCGVGLFSLPLARKFTKVFGIEASERAIEFAQKNAENARLANVEFFAENVGDFLNENKLENIDFVLLDPPRAGAERETIEAILRLNPKQISYVSCDPATLARDLKILTESLYQIESIAALDLFPQTHHVETVARLNRKS